MVRTPGVTSCVCYRPTMAFIPPREHWVLLNDPLCTLLVSICIS